MPRLLLFWDLHLRRGCGSVFMVAAASSSSPPPPQRTKRAGWVLSGIPAPESVSDHMYRMAVAAFALPPAVSAHAMKLALVHDLAEALVGDITPHDGVSGEEKERRERAAMATIRDEVLGGGAQGSDPAGQAVGAQLVALWEEYEAGETPAAALVKDVDKYEMVVQAYEYEKGTFVFGWEAAAQLVFRGGRWGGRPRRGGATGRPPRRWERGWLAFPRGGVVGWRYPVWGLRGRRPSWWPRRQRRRYGLNEPAGHPPPLSFPFLTPLRRGEGEFAPPARA